MKWLKLKRVIIKLFFWRPPHRRWLAEDLAAMDKLGLEILEEIEREEQA